MKKILIIEDDQLVANIYRNKFSVEALRGGNRAAMAKPASSCINSFQPDVVILDLMLPKMTGLDLMKKIRARTDLQQLPVIVFSNTYLSNMVQEAWKAGATKCLSKANCTPKQVIEVVRSLLAAAGAAPPAPRLRPPTPRPHGDRRRRQPNPTPAFRPNAPVLSDQPARARSPPRARPPSARQGRR